MPILRCVAVVLIAILLIACVADDEVIESDEVALARYSRARTEAMIACIELCADDGFSCSNAPGDCNARCVEALADIADFCMPVTTIWYRCVLALHPFCIDGSAYRYGCYAEYSAVASCL